MSSYRSLRETDDKDEEFWKWMDEVEKIVLAKSGLYLTDLPDEAFRLHFGNKVTYTKMAQDILASLAVEFGVFLDCLSEKY